MLKQNTIVRSYRKSKDGQIAVFFAIMALPLLAAVSAGVDYTNLVREEVHVKAALDAAVIAAANNSQISDENKPRFAEEHFRNNYSRSVPIKLVSTLKEDQISMQATGEVELQFGGFIGIKNLPVNDTSTAKLSIENTICVMALSEDADRSISFDTDIEFNAPTCTVHSNSTSAEAISAASTFKKPVAKSFCAIGGVEGLFDPAAKGECRTIEDPYKDRQPAEEGKCITKFLGADKGKPIDSSLQTGPGNALDVKLMDFVEVMDELTLRYGPSALDGRGADQGGNGDSRIGDMQSSLEQFYNLSAAQMALMLDAYDQAGEVPHCASGSGSRTDDQICAMLDGTPFADKPSYQLPSLSYAAEIMQMTYNDPFSPPTIDPTPLQDGRVELIAGVMYTRNNSDNKLIKISENLTGSSIQLKAGTYCGGLTVDGTSVKFGPGDYIFKDGPLTFLNNSRADAYDVTFGFKGAGATLNIESGSSVKIKAPSMGERKGLAFMQIVDADGVAREASANDAVNRIVSGGSLEMSGTAYFPTQILQIEGENSHIGSQSPAVGLIASQIHFRGARGARVNIAVDHQKAGIPPIEPRAENGAYLVE